MVKHTAEGSHEGQMGTCNRQTLWPCIHSCNAVMVLADPMPVMLLLVCMLEGMFGIASKRKLLQLQQLHLRSATGDFKVLGRSLQSCQAGSPEVDGT